MATGEPMLLVDAISGPGAVSGQMLPDAITGTSTPTELIPVWKAVDAAITYIDFYGQLAPTYAGGGLTLTFPYSTAATTGDVRWEAAFRRIDDDAEDLDTTAHTYDYNAVDDTTASAVGELSYPTLAFTSGADMDSLAAGERFILRVRRNGSHANDTSTAIAYLHGVHGKET